MFFKWKHIVMFKFNDKTGNGSDKIVLINKVTFVRTD